MATGTQVPNCDSSSVNISGAMAPPITPANVYARELPVDRSLGENCSTMKAACGPYMNECAASPRTMPTISIGWLSPPRMPKKMKVHTAPTTAPTP